MSRPDQTAGTQPGYIKPEGTGERILVAGIFREEGVRRQRVPQGSVYEAARDTPIYGKCDVLIAGGGPSGTAAAVAASRLGADVILL